MRRSKVVLLVAFVAVAFGSTQAARAELEPMLSAVAPRLMRLANDTPGTVALTVVDLRTGGAMNINGDVNLPAASLIKIPVMVEVMRQATLDTFTLERKVSILNSDRDCGSGVLCYAPPGSRYTVWYLTWAMITVSDNTATNALIRLVGREHVNQTMIGLGLNQTWLGDDIHSWGDVRELRTSANDMTKLLWMIADHRLINRQASDVMLQILSAQRHNGLLPGPLPRSLRVAHKTGTLHDTLNDVGIVDLDGSPYIICALTTHLPDLDAGRHFIRRASLLVYQAFERETGTDLTR